MHAPQRTKMNEGKKISNRKKKRGEKRVSLFDMLASECCQHLVCISSVFVIRFVEKSNSNAITTMIAWQMESKLGLFLSLSPLLSVCSIEHHLNAEEWRRIRFSFPVSNVFALVLLTVPTKKRIYRNLTIRKSCAENNRYTHTQWVGSQNKIGNIFGVCIGSRVFHWCSSQSN